MPLTGESQCTRGTIGHGGEDCSLLHARRKNLRHSPREGVGWLGAKVLRVGICRNRIRWETVANRRFGSRVVERSPTVSKIKDNSAITRLAKYVRYAPADNEPLWLWTKTVGHDVTWS